jgi:HJR/Mrr/RecB family endonuclease
VSQYHPEIISAYIEQWESADVREGETILHELLRPMFEREGYTVIRTEDYKDRPLDYWDFIVSRNPTDRFRGLSIGIEHKAFTRKKVDTETVEQVLSSARASQLDRACIFSRSGFSDAALEYASKVAAPHLELFDPPSLRRWADGLRPSEQDATKHVHAVFTNLSRVLVESVAANPRYLDKLEWFDIERLLAEAFDGLGFKVTHTRSSKDEGKDIILECEIDGQEKSYIVEVKHWRAGGKVGSKSVNDFLKVIGREKREGGLFLSTSGYTGNAFESLSEVERRVLRFGGEQKVHAICRTYVRARGGLWSPQMTLADSLFEATE